MRLSSPARYSEARTLALGTRRSWNLTPSSLSVAMRDTVSSMSARLSPGSPRIRWTAMRSPAPRPRARTRREGYPARQGSRRSRGRGGSSKGSGRASFAVPARPISRARFRRTRRAGPPSPHRCSPASSIPRGRAARRGRFRSSRARPRRIAPRARAGGAKVELKAWKYGKEEPRFIAPTQEGDARLDLLGDRRSALRQVEGSPGLRRAVAAAAAPSPGTPVRA